MKLKKPKFWDYKKPNLFALILYPFAVILALVSSFKKKTSENNLKIKTICFGNIYIGGTGKTSLSLELNKLLSKKNIRSCFVKKFYKDQYDEQKLLMQNGKLFLSNKRIDALKNAEKENYKIAILDDGLQDKSINADINIICFNNTNWIGNGMTIPSGPLRESFENIKNYKHIFLNGNSENIEDIKQKVLETNPLINIYLGEYRPLNIDKFKKTQNYLVFSGIGNHRTFVSMLKNHGLKILKDLEFPDHFQFRKNDIDKIIKQADDLNCEIITTEKDYLRLENLTFKKIRFIRSQIKILDEEKFLNVIL
tara:strand:+ start:2126 stop:3052 length:927 start_codon:yes stop_codon:yes gene_type:complete